VKLDRYRLEMDTGEPLAPGVVVRHACDRRNCLSRDCLLLGSQLQNMADASARGRLCRGERHHRAVLTRAAVRVIRRRAARGEAKVWALAQQFDVAGTTVRDVVARKTWAWLR
jgi:hypothetical protein